jgi:protein-tyrosine phosphatase
VEEQMDILVVCTGNICRSPMAEGLLRHMLPEKSLPAVHVHSAGTHGLDDQPAASFAIQAAAEMGVDISGHRARSLDREMVSHADPILVMEPFHKEIVARAVLPQESDRIRLLADFETPRQSETIDDPYNHSLKVYRACLIRIRDCLEGVLPYLESARQANA